MLELLQAITGIFVVVYEGQHALKFTLGRAVGIVGPGVHFKWPIVQRFAVYDTRHTTLDLEPQTVQLRDDLVFDVDVKVLYQIVDLMRAVIEIDDLVAGLQNRIAMTVQRVLGAQTRLSIYDAEGITRQIRERLADVERDWGVRFLQVGFSNLSPSPATLEITQLDLLARERLDLYTKLVNEGLVPEHAVALVTGAVIATQTRAPAPSIAARRREEERLSERLVAWSKEVEDPAQSPRPNEAGEAEGPPDPAEPR